MTPDHEERLICALESLAASAARVVAANWPEAKTRTPEELEPTIHSLKSEEERLREEQRGNGADIEEWLGEDIAEEEPGPREKELERQRASGTVPRETRSKPRATSAGSSDDEASE